MDDFVSQAGAGYSQKDRTITHKNKDRVPTGRAGNVPNRPIFDKHLPVMDSTSSHNSGTCTDWRNFTMQNSFLLSSGADTRASRARPGSSIKMDETAPRSRITAVSERKAFMPTRLLFKRLRIACFSNSSRCFLSILHVHLLVYRYGRGTAPQQDPAQAIVGL